MIYDRPPRVFDNAPEMDIVEKAGPCKRADGYEVSAWPGVVETV